MVNTKIEVKIKLKEWIQKNDKSFTTKEAIQSLQTENKSKVRLSPSRITNFIRGTRAATFDPKTKTWKPKNIMMPRKLSRISKG